MAPKRESHPSTPRQQRRGNTRRTAARAATTPIRRATEACQKIVSLIDGISQEAYAAKHGPPRTQTSVHIQTAEIVASAQFGLVRQLRAAVDAAAAAVHVIPARSDRVEWQGRHGRTYHDVALGIGREVLEDFEAALRIARSDHRGRVLIPPVADPWARKSLPAVLFVLKAGRWERFLDRLGKIWRKDLDSLRIELERDVVCAERLRGVRLLRQGDRAAKKQSRRPKIVVRYSANVVAVNGQPLASGQQAEAFAILAKAAGNPNGAIVPTTDVGNLRKTLIRKRHKALADAVSPGRPHGEGRSLYLFNIPPGYILKPDGLP